MNDQEKEELKKFLLSDNGNKKIQHRASEFYYKRYKKSFGNNISLVEYVPNENSWKIFNTSDIKNSNEEKWSQTYEQILGRVESIGAPAYDNLMNSLSDILSGGMGNVPDKIKFYENIKPALTLYIIALWAKQDITTANHIFKSFSELEYVNFLVDNCINAFEKREWYIFHTEKIDFPTSSQPLIAYDQKLENISHLLELSESDKEKEKDMFYKNIFLSEFIILPLGKNNLLVIADPTKWIEYGPDSELIKSPDFDVVMVEHHQNLQNSKDNTIKLFTDEIHPVRVVKPNGILKNEEHKCLVFFFSPVYLAHRVASFYLNDNKEKLLYGSALSGNIKKEDREQLNKELSKISLDYFKWHLMEVKEEEEIEKKKKYIPNLVRSIIKNNNQNFLLQAHVNKIIISIK